MTYYAAVRKRPGGPWVIVRVTEEELRARGLTTLHSDIFEYLGDMYSDFDVSISTSRAVVEKRLVQLNPTPTPASGRTEGRDPVHDWTDGELERLERAMAREYGTAVREMRSKLDRFLKGYERELSQRLKALDDTPEARKALEAWKGDRAADRRYLQGMVDALSQDLEHARDRAMALLEDRVPRIYAENANYGAFEVDRAARVDTAFNLMDEDTARQLIGGGGALFEPPRPDAARVRAWTDRKLTSAVTQGILQGESIPHIASRVRSVAQMSASAAVRTARTACTGAENAGRVSSYQRAERLGIGLRQEWLATLDTRTRDSHRVLDGERVAVGEEFSNGLRFPGDPQGPGREVYNCRCTLVAAVDGVDQSAAARFSRLPQGMSYEEWREQARARMAGAGSRPQVVNPDHSIWRVAGQEAATAADELLAGADDLVQSVWREYEESLTMGDVASDKAYYNPIWGVHLNLDNDLADTSGTGRMSVFFHEFGHNIDWASGSRNGMGYLTDGSPLRETILDEVEGLVRDRRRSLAEMGLPSSREDAYASIAAEVRGMDRASKHSLSDILEGATNGGIRAGWGHGTDYWNDESKLAAEAFAEFFSAECVYSQTPETLDVLRQWLPESYNMFRQHLKIAMGGSLE